MSLYFCSTLLLGSVIRKERINKFFIPLLWVKLSTQIYIIETLPIVLHNVSVCEDLVFKEIIMLK